MRGTHWHDEGNTCIAQSISCFDRQTLTANDVTAESRYVIANFSCITITLAMRWMMPSAAMR